MMPFRDRPRLLTPLLLTAMLAACSGKGGESEGSASTGDAGTATTGASATTTAGSESSTVASGGTDSTTNGTTATTGGTNVTATDSTTNTSTDATTNATTDATTNATTDATTTTGGGACEIDLPEPGNCNGPPAPAPSPTLAVLGASSSLARPGPVVILGDEPEEATTGCAFICPPDVGEPIACDLFSQDCAPGEKCNAWANDGGSSWNATKCVPVDPDPDKIGETCTVEGSGVSGIDTCEAGAMCWAVDGETNEGTCVEICTCTPDNPVCTTPNTTCAIANDGVLVLCLPVCDPLSAGACGDGEVCIGNPYGEYFICVVDASDAGGATGDPCEYLNACDPGHFCAAADTVPNCQSSGCCTPYCDIGGNDCPGGTECVAWYDQGMAPKCFEDLGACVGG